MKTSQGRTIIEMPSRHGDDREPRAGVIIHAMAEFIDAEDRDYYAPNWLEKLGLSAHEFITPSGQVIVCRPPTKRAWHAKGFNRFYGIEIMVPGLHTYATFLDAIQTDWCPEGSPSFEGAVERTRAWFIRRYGQACDPREAQDGLLRHCDVDPGRKKDPGSGFPWERFVERVKQDISARSAC